MDDIDREKKKESREKMKKEISEDITDVIDNVFNKKKKQKMSILGIITRGLLFLFLGLIIIDLVLGSIWLLKELIKSLFLNG